MSAWLSCRPRRTASTAAVPDRRTARTDAPFHGVLRLRRRRLRGLAGRLWRELAGGDGAHVERVHDVARVRGVVVPEQVPELVHDDGAELRPVPGHGAVEHDLARDVELGTVELALRVAPARLGVRARGKVAPARGHVAV